MLARAPHIGANDTLTLAHAVATVMWPAIVVLALLLFRRPLEGLIRRLTHASVFGASIDAKGLVDATTALAGVAANEAADPELRQAAADAVPPLGRLVELVGTTGPAGQGWTMPVGTEPASAAPAGRRRGSRRSKPSA